MNRFLCTVIAALLLTGAAAGQRIPAAEPTVATPLVGSWAPMDLSFQTVTVDGVGYDHATWTVGAMAFDVVLLPNGLVSVSLGGQQLALGSEALLDGLPGAASASTAGAIICYMIPLPGGGYAGPMKVQVTGTAEGLSGAVADFKAKKQELAQAGWIALPGACG